MLLRHLLVGAALAAAVTAQAPVVSTPRHLALVRTTGPAQLHQLLQLDLDLAGCQPPLPAQRRVEVIVDDREFQRLQQLGFDVRILQRDLSAWYAAQAARYPGIDLPNPPLGQGAMGGHWTLAQMEAILDGLFATNPAICSAKVAIGNSWENRPIWMVKISDHVGVDEPEPEVLYDALHHSREPLSMEATLVFMEWLVNNYGTDPEATLIVDERELYFVPCVNPDGYEYNRTTSPGGGGMWRKNRRNNGDGTFGVDLNRNYATAWNAPNGGSSTATNSDTYRGPGAFSEPETQALEAFAASRQFVTVFTTHTYTDVLLRPWGWQNGNPANASDYDLQGAYLVQENGVQHGSISALLYIASGSSVDHHHTVRGSMAWTAELGRSDEGGFWPSGPTINAIANRHQPMFRKVALTAGPRLLVAATAVAEGPGANGNGVVEAGEAGTLVVTVGNRGQSAANATVAWSSLTPGISLGSSGTMVAVGRLADAVATPLPFTVAPGTTAAQGRLLITITGDGLVTTHTTTFDLLARRLLLADDFERHRGFERAPLGTATTGLWERAAPIATTNGGTTIQPGTQTTPGGSQCWVTDGRGGSAGTYDVDGGYTDLWSPVLDLAHLQSAELRLQYWYAESVGNDPMELAISRDGGSSWTPAFTRSTASGAWTALVVDLGAPLTAQMRVRVRAQDLAASLVECLIDDFAVHGVAVDGSLSLLASGAPSSWVQVNVAAAPGTLCFPLASFGTSPGTTLPGVAGTLLVDPVTVMVQPLAIADASGRAVTELALPAGPGFTGLVFWWQVATFGPGGVAFGPNRTALTLQ